MGIRGFGTFTRERGIFKEHRLHDTILIIDGFNLYFELYSSFLRVRADLRYGGDYTYQAAHISRFFAGLLDCGITPIVIMDGTFRQEKIGTIRRRCKDNIARALGVFQGEEEVTTGYCQFGQYVLIEVVKRLGIRHFQAIYEADDVVAQLGADLKAPVLSDDSDFLLMPTLKSGVISIKSVVDSNPVTDPDSGVKYISCSLYQIKFLKQHFPGLKYKKIPLAGALLGNDYLYYKKGQLLIEQLPQPGEEQEFSNPRQCQIFTVFQWLAKHESRESVLTEIQGLCGGEESPNDPLLKYISNHCPELPKSTASDPLPIDDYFTQKKLQLFPLEPNIPEWAYERYLIYKCENRLISITQLHFDNFSQVIEDFEVWDSVYQAVFGLCKRIYAVLRMEDNEPKKVQRIGRRGPRKAEARVDPECIVNGLRLPKIAEVSSLSEAKRIDLFFFILNLDANLPAEFKKIFSSTIPIDDAKQTQLTTFIISLIYLCRHLDLPFWIEVLYSLLVNFLFMGHFNTVENVPTVLELDEAIHQKLMDELGRFDTLPGVENYQPKIVHFYSSFQAVMKNVRFLAQILDLSEVFNTDLLVSGLQGTFIYNLAMDLATKTQPLYHLEQHILKKVDPKLTALFQQLLDLILKCSLRNYLFTGKAAGFRDVVPVFVKKTPRSIDQTELRLVRGPLIVDTRPVCPGCYAR